MKKEFNNRQFTSKLNVNVSKFGSFPRTRLCAKRRIQKNLNVLCFRHENIEWKRSRRLSPLSLAHVTHFIFRVNHRFFCQLSKVVSFSPS